MGFFGPPSSNVSDQSDISSWIGNLSSFFLLRRFICILCQSMRLMLDKRCLYDWCQTPSRKFRRIRFPSSLNLFVLLESFPTVHQLIYNMRCHQVCIFALVRIKWISCCLWMPWCHQRSRLC